MKQRCALTTAAPLVFRPAGLVLLVLLLRVSVALAAPSQVYVRGTGGQWTTLPGETVNGRVTVRLAAPQIAGGSATVVVNKPAWMVLADYEAPKLAWLKVNGQESEAGEGHLGAVSGFPLSVAFGVKDDANPLDASAIRVDFDGGAARLQIDTSGSGFPKANGRVVVTWPKLDPGVYHAVLHVPDMAPSANELTVPLDFTVTGVRVSADQQLVTLVGKQGTYALQADAQKTLQAGNAPPAYLTCNVAGQHMYLDKITGVQTLTDQPGLKVVRVSGLVGQTDKKQDGTKLCRVEYDLTLRDDLPCLLVKSRTINLAPKGGLYCWWGWLPGTKWVDAKGEHEWSNAYKDVGKVGWVYLPSANPETNGLGWISPAAFGESRFGTMLLYTDPRTIETDTGAAVEIPFALMAAGSAAEVAAAAEKIKSLNLWH